MPGSLMPDSAGRPVVAITGGLSGIGAATAVAFARRGAYLSLWDRRVCAEAQVLAAVRDAGGDGHAIEVDVRRHSEVTAAAQRLRHAQSRIDVLVVAAGIADQSRVDLGDPDRWQQVIDTNLLGSLYAARAVLPTMRSQQEGHIFFVASVSGRETYAGEPAYIASKWGQVGFAHALRQEVLDAGLRVTLIEPGLVDTPLTRTNPTVRPMLEQITPLIPDDVATAIVFAYAQPAHVVISELTVRPLRQRLPQFADDPTDSP